MTTITEPTGARVETDDETGDVPVLHFRDGIPGFLDLHDFTLVRIDDTGLILDLQSLEDTSVRFVVVPSVAFFPGYAPEIPDPTAAALSLSTADDALVLLVLKVGQTLQDTKANLRAPIVVNRANQQAAQVVLDDPELSLRAPLLPVEG